MICTNLKFAIIVKEVPKCIYLQGTYSINQQLSLSCAFMGNIISWSCNSLQVGNNKGILKNYLGIDLTHLISA